MQRRPETEKVNANRVDGGQPCGAVAQDCGCTPSSASMVLRVPAATGLGLRLPGTRAGIGPGETTEGQGSEIRSDVCRQVPCASTRSGLGVVAGHVMHTDDRHGTPSHTLGRAPTIHKAAREIRLRSLGNARPLFEREPIQRRRGPGCEEISAFVPYRVDEFRFPMIELPIAAETAMMTRDQHAAFSSAARPLEAQELNRPLELFTSRRRANPWLPDAWIQRGNGVVRLVQGVEGYEIIRVRRPGADYPLNWVPVATIDSQVRFYLGDVFRMLAGRSGCVGPVVRNGPEFVSWTHNPSGCLVPPLARGLNPENATWHRAYSVDWTRLRKTRLHISIALRMQDAGVQSAHQQGVARLIPGFDGVVVQCGPAQDTQETVFDELSRGGGVDRPSWAVAVGSGRLYPEFRNQSSTLAGGGAIGVMATSYTESVRSVPQIDPDLPENSPVGGVTIRRSARPNSPVGDGELPVIVAPRGIYPVPRDARPGRPVGIAPAEVLFSEMLRGTRCKRVKFDLIVSWHDTTGGNPYNYSYRHPISAEFVECALCTMRVFVSTGFSDGVVRTMEAVPPPGTEVFGDQRAGFSFPWQDGLTSVGLSTFSTQQAAGTAFEATLESVAARLVPR